MGDERLSLYAPEYLVEEFQRHYALILKKSGLTDDEFSALLSRINTRIRFVPAREIVSWMPLAEQICPDYDDVHYFALCLAKRLPLWSNDTALKRQDAVTVLTTDEISVLLTSLE
ncbi:MAG: PIN domain-containing protein [Candidatus Woesearchaeota archaeon]